MNNTLLPPLPGEVLGHGYPDWPEDLTTFAERKAYQRGVADARALVATQVRPPDLVSHLKDVKAGASKWHPLHDAQVQLQSHTGPWGDLETALNEFIEDYEFRGGDGDYRPTANERMLIADAVMAILGDEDIVPLLSRVFADRNP